VARPKKSQQAKSRLRQFLADNGLAIACFALFLGFLVGQSLTGWHVHNDDAQQHGGHAIGYPQYLTTGHFYEAVFENWESEFLQMGAFVLLTMFLVQRGSAESKHPDQHNDVDTDPVETKPKSDAPWPVRHGGIWLKLYANSLLIAFFALFLMSILGHGLSGARQFNDERLDHHERSVSTIRYMESSQFWFESMQNWQSEFLAVGAIVVFTIFLRQKGSPESKPVAMPNKAMQTT
jgi:hypothetical protein